MSAMTARSGAKLVPLEANGQTYQTVLDTEAMVALESLVSTRDQYLTTREVIALMLRGSVYHTQAFVWASLRRHHPAITMEQTAALIDSLGGIEGYYERVGGKVVDTTQPDPEDVDPQQQASPGRGIGAPATSMPAGSDSRRTSSGG